MNILIVDDEAGQCSLLEAFVKNWGHTAITANSGNEAISILDHSTSEPSPQQIHLIYSDVHMVDGDGFQLLEHCQRKHPKIPFILLTGYADIKQAVDAISKGAISYLEKPIDLDELKSISERYLPSPSKTSEEQEETLALQEGTVLEDPSMKHLYRDIFTIAPSQARVMILGESGCGKENVAEHLHRWSERHQKSLIKVNCASFSESLLESELFGHEKGAFTGAQQARQGCFERADGGTLFLDEIADMSLACQAKCLRVLQEQCFTRLGGHDDIQVDVRVIAATHKDLEKEIEEGRFREDLYYRLNVVELFLPPLRDRQGDIIPLAEAFITKFSQTQVRRSKAFDKAILSYRWPGNVRELQNAMERAVLLCRGGILMPEHLPKRVCSEWEDKDPSTPENSASSTSSRGSSLEEQSKELILKVLTEHHGNRSHAAKALGISRRTLLYRLKKLQDEGIKVPPPHRESTP